MCSDHERDGSTRHLAAAFVELDQVGAAGHALARARGRDRRVDRARGRLLRRPRPRPPSADELRARLRQRIARARPADPAWNAWCSRSPSPRAGAACPPSTSSRFAPDCRRHPRGGRLAARPAPEMAERLRLWRMSEFELERIPSAADVYLFRGRRARQPQGRAAVRARRGARPDARARRGRARRRAARARAHAGRGARGDARASRPTRARARARCCGTACCSTSGRAIDLAPEELRARDRRATPARPRASASRWCSMRGRMREPAASVRERELRLFAPPGAAWSSRSTIRPRARCSRSTRARGGSCRRAAAAPCTRPSSSRCSRPHAATAARAAPGEFIEHDLDADGQLVPVDRRPATNEAGIVVGRGAQLHRALPRGHAARRAARRPDEGARLARRARVPADHRRARPRRGARRAGRVVRALGRRAGSRWTPAPRTWTGSPRCCAGSSSSPSAAARSTSSSPASTSARSRTGTPRRRCSCTRAASW